MPTWRERKNPCRVYPDLFYPELVDDESGTLVELTVAFDEDGNQIDRTREAKLLCSSCPSRVPCLDYAIKRPEEFGIWGGMGSDLRLWLRSQYLAGPPVYRAALVRAFDELDVWAHKPGATREDQPAGTCPRCKAMIRAGKRPIDRNGPGARCGKPSTYNRGCRCIPCVVSKSVADSRRDR